MKLLSKDFVPEKSKGTLFKSGKIQSFQDAIDSANVWLAENPQVKIINVETVVLPNIHSKDEEGSHDTELWTGKEFSSQWYQLLRVWYQM